MELNRHRPWAYRFSISLVAALMLMGLWWIILFNKIATQIEYLDLNSTITKYIFILKWEVPFFFMLLIGMLIFFIILYWKDQRKNLTLHAFFSSLTHELKTPLASIRLQAQVMEEIIDKLEDQSKKVKLKKYSSRLQQDSEDLEIFFEKLLQLSRLNTNSNLELASIPVTSFIKEIAHSFPVKLIFKNEMNPIILADPIILKLVFKNILDNTSRHNKGRCATIGIYLDDASHICLTYQNNDDHFLGDKKLLGQLFYKYNSPKGSGIGLYLCHQLLKSMKGSLKISNHKDFTLIMKFNLAESAGNE